MKNIRPALIAILAIAVTTPAHASEKRCGWLANDSPANWSLTDAVGEWTIGAQGGFQAEGMDNIPDMTTKDWVSYFGRSYGYGCACMTVDTGKERQRITRIYSAKPIPLKRCRADKKIPKR